MLKPNQNQKLKKSIEKMLTQYPLNTVVTAL